MDKHHGVIVLTNERWTHLNKEMYERHLDENQEDEQKVSKRAQKFNSYILKIQYSINEDEGNI